MRSKVLPFAIAISLAILGTAMATAQVQGESVAIHDLAQVPELHFRNVVYTESPDHYIEELRENNPGLAGLPFVADEDRRLEGAEREKFAAAVLNVRESLRKIPTRNAFWEKCIHVPADKHAVAALMQMVATDERLLPGLVAYLGGCDFPEATQALARLAIFSQEPELRRLARAFLQKRDTRPATDILLKGLRYPWPPVARHAAEAVAELRCTDLAPELAQMLTEPDPRAPVRRTIQGKEVYVIRELVRVNHLRNCLLCHVAADTPAVVWEGKFDPPNVPDRSAARLVGELLSLFRPRVGRDGVDRSVARLAGVVPTPGRAVPLWSQPPRNINDTAVRADLTYLRQDFSLLQPVAKAAPWPPVQRFDFLVRERVLTDEEARAYQAEFGGRQETSPYRQAAASALRALTGPDNAARGKPLWIALGCTSLVLLPGALIYRFRRSRSRRRSVSVVGSPA